MGDEHWDTVEAEQLYRLLEEEVIPCFYNRDAGGIPREWIRKIRRAMATIVPRFSADRMLKEYVNECYKRPKAG